MEDAYQTWLTKKKRLEDAGYNLVVMWECQLKEELKRNPEMKDFFASVNPYEPMTIRSALKGGNN